MKDRDLREKVKQYGMPGKGPRAVLIERLKEFTLRYNAQCDSNPKTSELVTLYIMMSVFVPDILLF